MVDRRQKIAERTPVRANAADRDPAEAGSVITALSADEARPAALPQGTVVGQGHLQRRVDRLRPRVREEDVIEVARGQIRQPLRELERPWMPHLESRNVLQATRLVGDRVGDPVPAVAGVDTPQACRRIEDAPAVGQHVMHAVPFLEQDGIALESPVGREGHPEGIHGTGGGWGIHGFGLWLIASHRSLIPTNAIIAFYCCKVH